MAKGISRRGFLATAAAAGSVKLLPQVVGKMGGKRVLTLVWDKSIGAMRAIDRLVP
ncbi:twin-arginine translocation signal domain-containing protein [Pseudorhodobacter sp. E13]|uniref:twin-arginine translocation signal domain-containing protein n=1 Tax=Pseudorhodobacter sp. E13 TaxID=2487931 RepID=UPI000F8F759B|nr:twin-arginine translocation signal domain-containing protein [Pseudorhodobacter sp. E13]RUS60032.1 twin-arginine translocation signal domain-containing protein [Pseudorhodobacter sp. E13]